MKLKISIFLSASLLLISACTLELRDCINPEGAETTRIITLDDTIDRIVLQVPVELIVTQGSEQEITIQGAANIIDAIESDSRVQNNRFEIRIQGCSDVDGVKVFAQLLSIEQLAIEGSGTIKAEDPFDNLKDLELDIQGSGDITCIVDDGESLKALIQGSGVIQIEGSNVLQTEHKIEGSGKIDFEYLESDEVFAGIEGSGKITGEGKTDEADFKIVGSGELKMKDLISQDIVINIDGSGEMEVHVEKSLTGKIRGSGKICYEGQPIESVDIDGSGSVSPGCD